MIEFLLLKAEIHGPLKRQIIIKIGLDKYVLYFYFIFAGLCRFEGFVPYGLKRIINLVVVVVVNKRDPAKTN